MSNYKTHAFGQSWTYIISENYGLNDTLRWQFAIPNIAQLLLNCMITHWHSCLTNLWLGPQSAHQSITSKLTGASMLPTQVRIKSQVMSQPLSLTASNDIHRQFPPNPTKHLQCLQTHTVCASHHFTWLIQKPFQLHMSKSHTTCISSTLVSVVTWDC